MSLVDRDLFPLIDKETSPKAVVIVGARRTGKTTLLEVLAKKHESVRWYSGDDPTHSEELQLSSASDVELALMQAEALIIDEAQRIPNICLTLKRLVDANERLAKPRKIYATASSSLDLAKGVKESAVGRLVKYEMWPLSISEIAAFRSWGELRQNIDRLIVYGTYPNAFIDPENARRTLRDYCDGILYKDLFELSGIRLNNKFEALVCVLAYNIGSEVNYDNLSRETGLNKTTVADYVTLLEQCNIVRVCPSYAKNLANEIKKGKKIYFVDTGIRNAIMNDFSPMSARRDRDAGALWENFFFIERLKFHSLRQDSISMYFWRTSGNKTHELDFVEVKDGKMRAFECKLSKTAKANPGDAFKKAYPDCPIDVVTPADLMKLWLQDENAI